MGRKWYVLGLMVFAAACGPDDDAELDELDTIDTEEQTLPPAAPMDTTMMGPDTMMMGDTMAGDTMGM